MTIANKVCTHCYGINCMTREQAQTWEQLIQGRPLKGDVRIYQRSNPNTFAMAI